MKIRVRETWNDYDETGEWIEDDDNRLPLVEVPDAIVIAWREAQQRIADTNAWLTEQVKPIIEAHRIERKRQWRLKHSEETVGDDLVNDRWTRLLFGQFKEDL